MPVIVDRLDGLYDEPRPGAKRSITDAQVEDVIIRTLEPTPRGATHWSTRGMAKAVERWFAELTMKQIRRGTFRSVPRLKDAIQEFIDAHQAGPRPFVCTKSADEILASIARFARRTVDARAAQSMSRTTVTGH